MRRQRYGLYLTVALVVIAGLLALGVRPSTLLLGVLLLAGPIMMMRMHGGGHAGAGGCHGGHGGHSGHGTAGKSSHPHGVTGYGQDQASSPADSERSTAHDHRLG